MKKFLFSLMAIVLVSLSGNAQPQTNEEVWRMLKSIYDYEKVNFNIDESKNSVFANTINTNSFITKNARISDLNLTDITEVIQKDGKKFLIIPFKENVKYSLFVSINGNNYSSFLKTLIVKNDVDTKGNGSISTITEDETVVHSFNNGENISTGATIKKSCFRTCFDQAYDDVCDGFIGCVAWYTNPGIAVMAAAYCEIKC